MIALAYSWPLPYLILSSFCFYAGGYWMSLPFFFLAVGSVLLDGILPHDRAAPPNGASWIFNLALYLTLPATYLLILSFNWQMAQIDPARNPWQILGAYLSLSLSIAGTATVAAHELVHRVWSRPSLLMGRWLLAPTLDSSFSIEHVYGHHAHVATRRDPASARRGESVYTFILRSTFGSLRSAWQIEKQRLEKREGKGPFTWTNRVLSGQLMSLAVLILFIAFQGYWGIPSFFLSAILGKIFLEAINYVEHYGLAREEGKAVSPHHSWNCTHRFSTRFLFNLSRHSHHHAKGQLPYYKLQVADEAPNFPHGYMLMMVLAFIPPLFRKTIAPYLHDWDLRLASEKERFLAQA